MPATRFLHRRRASRRPDQTARQERNHPDMLARKDLLCDELARIDGILARLRDRRRIGPDMSSDDLFELFREERDRLFAQLRAVDTALSGDPDEETPPQDAAVIDFRRRGPAKRPDFS